MNKKNVYIGRKGVVFISGKDGTRFRYPSKSSLWANPFKIENNDREECLRKYREYIVKKIEEENLIYELLDLKDKILGCWCAPEQCHGHVLQELIELYSK
jgi:hypothetical protein